MKISATATPTFCGSPSRLAGQVHDAAHALDEEVVAGALGVGAGLAEAGHRAIDQARIEPRCKACVVEADICVKPPTLKFSISTSAPAGEPPDDLLALARSRSRRDDRALAAIAGMEIGRVALLAVAVSRKGGPQRRVSSPRRALDLDDIGAEIGQRLPDPWAGENAREFDDLHSGKRAHEEPVGAPCARKACDL